MNFGIVVRPEKFNNSTAEAKAEVFCSLSRVLATKCFDNPKDCSYSLLSSAGMQKKKIRSNSKISLKL